MTRPGYTVVRDGTAAEFAGYAWDLLARDPVRDNVLCTLVEARYTGDRSQRYWLRVLDGDRLVGVAIGTPSRGLLLGDLPGAGARAMAEHLVGVPTLPAANGPPAAVEAFARHYAVRAGVGAAPGRAQRLFRLDAVTPPAAVPGGPRAATPADRALILAWLGGFARDARGSDRVTDDDLARVDTLLRYPDLVWFWEVDGAPVSFAWRSPVRPPGSWPRTPVTRVSAVYTPAGHRGHGYASANVAALSRRALDAGVEACVLYADLANPVSNKIYRRIGYRPVADAHEWLFS